MWEAQLEEKKKKKGLGATQLKQYTLQDTQKTPKSSRGFKGRPICPDLADTDPKKLEHTQDFILLYILTALQASKNESARNL